MSDLQRQIGENAQVRASAEASVSGLCEVAADGVSCSVVAEEHRRIYHGGLPAPSRFPGLTFREQREAYEAVLVFRSASGRTEVARRAEGFSVHVLHGSDRLTTAEARRLGAKLARYPDATPEPQQADASPLLDLVQQYGAESYEQGVAAGQRDEGAEDHYDDKARALLARIAALVPQQPVQARDERGWLWWIHGCGHVGAAQTGLPDECCDSGPWRPLLVGGDPAPEQPSAPDFLASINMLTIQRDEARAESEKRLDALIKARAEVERLRSKLERGHVCTPACSPNRHVAHVGRRALDEALAEVERLTSRVRHLEVELAGTQQMLDVMTAQPDPLVLSLPEVPEGTVALDGGTWGRPGDLPWSLASILADEPNGVRVELAPPREPRTAVEIWASLHPDERSDLRRDEYAILAAALDREAGL